jgi:hypothetical protein
MTVIAEEESCRTEFKGFEKKKMMRFCIRAAGCLKLSHRGI